MIKIIKSFVSEQYKKENKKKKYKKFLKWAEKLGESEKTW